MFYIKNKNTDQKYISTGMSFGSALAMILSWSINHSILWAILHGIFSWFYVIYYAFKY